MVATVPVPMISYFTTLGLNGSGSLTRPAPGLVSTVWPKNPRKRSTTNNAMTTTSEDHQQYPDALGETQHQTIRSRPSLLIYALF